MVARVLPEKSELEKMLRSGMTHQQIADAVAEQTGYPVSRSTVSAAIHRAGLSDANRRYTNEIPWRVRTKHLNHYAVRMLRLLGRRRAGLDMSPDMVTRLENWLDMLRETHSVVTYLPDTNEGFFYVDGDFTDDGIPVIERVEGL